MALGLGRPSLDNGSPEITPQQERSLAVEQNTANLGNIERQLDSKLENKDVFNGYPEEAKGILKDALMKECYIQFGSNPTITNIDSFYNFKNNQQSISLTIDRVLDIEIKPFEILENHKLNNDASFDIEGLKVSIKADAVEVKAAQEELKFNNNKEVLSEAFFKALQYRSDFMADRNEEIKNTSLWDKIRGKAPDPIPSVAEVSLSKEEILRHVPLSHRDDEQFLKMADAMVERLDKLVVKDNAGVEFWGTMKASLVDTAEKQWDNAREAFTNVDDRIQSGSNANSNYAAMGLDDASVSQYIQDRMEAGDSVEWISAKLAAKNIGYSAWNAITWGALKENDMLAVQHADGEITESEMKNRQYLNGGIALAYTATAGYGASARAFVPVAQASFKIHVVGSIVSGGANIGIQYATTGKVDVGSAGIATAVGFVIPGYSYKGFLAVSSAGIYVDQLRQGNSLVDSGISLAVGGATNSLGYGISHLAVNNHYVFSKVSQEYRNNLYKNAGENYIKNYTSFKDSSALAKYTIIGNSLGTISGEGANNASLKVIKNDKD